jgi:predicted O-methyltransferase YrrM
MLREPMLNDLQTRVRARLARPVGVRARHAEISAIASLDDEPAQPSARLLDIAERVIPSARLVSMEPVSARIASGPKWPDVWPGEHYKLLAALVKVMGAKRVVEVGTYQGLGTLALMQSLPPDGSLATFDIVPYADVEGHVLRQEDFEDGRLTQVIADITTDDGFAENQHLLRGADLIFADAAKDGQQERVFLRRFEEVGFTGTPVVVFDDIRVYNMLQIWREIARPKLDITSFGHWSGTGLVDYSGV